MFIPFSTMIFLVSNKRRSIYCNLHGLHFLRAPPPQLLGESIQWKRLGSIDGKVCLWSAMRMVDADIRWSGGSKHHHGGRLMMEMLWQQGAEMFAVQKYHVRKSAFSNSTNTMGTQKILESCTSSCWIKREKVCQWILACRSDWNLIGEAMYRPICLIDWALAHGSSLQSHSAHCACSDLRTILKFADGWRSSCEHWRATRCVQQSFPRWRRLLYFPENIPAHTSFFGVPQQQVDESYL